MKNIYTLLSILIISLTVYLSFDDLMPSSVKSIESTGFSFDNALNHLKVISKEPHYTGSKYHQDVQNYIVNELKKMGLETEIQNQVVLSSRRVGTNAANIIGTIKGSRKGKSLVLLTHYDSSAHSSFGASDAGSGVVTILEGLRAYLHENKIPKNDIIILISDTGMIANDIPSITTGLRGLSYVEVEITGPNRDLHSGLYGGAVANPINILTKMIASLHDENNHITVPGFYEKVEELSRAERDEMAKAPFSLDSYKKALNISAVYGEEGYTTNERNSIRPTLDVNGIWGGYTGEGAKTVIASKAYAKISMRLVPNQEWHEITELFTKHFESIAPEAVTVKVTPHHGGQGYVTPINTIGYKAASKAYEATFGKTPIPQRSGGSIPIVSLFEDELKSKTILMGFGLDSDAIHSPNEHFGIFNYLKGIETIPYFYKYFTELSK